MCYIINTLIEVSTLIEAATLREVSPSLQVKMKPALLAFISHHLRQALLDN